MTLIGNKAFVDVIKLRIVGRDQPGLDRPNSNEKSLEKKRRRNRHREKSLEKMETQIGIMKPQAKEYQG